MTQCKTQADCFRELARVMDMCEGTSVNWWACIMYEGTRLIELAIPNFFIPKCWSFAIAIVEDKPVFIGDTLYYIGEEWIARPNYSSDWWRLCSWNSPKPKEPEIPEGFTRHDSGECPVHPDTVIDIVFRSGSSKQNVYAKSYRWDFMNGWDVVAYKVIKPVTVMVELTREDAEILSHRGDVPNWDVVSEACRKALKGE